jgi:hypothetical protein
MDVQSFVNQQQQTRDRMRWVVIQDGNLAIRIAGQTHFRWSPRQVIQIFISCWFSFQAASDRFRIAGVVEVVTITVDRYQTEETK